MPFVSAAMGTGKSTELMCHLAMKVNTYVHIALIEPNAALTSSVFRTLHAHAAKYHKTLTVGLMVGKKATCPRAKIIVTNAGHIPKLPAGTIFVYDELHKLSAYALKYITDPSKFNTSVYMSATVRTPFFAYHNAKAKLLTLASEKVYSPLGLLYAHDNCPLAVRDVPDETILFGQCRIVGPTRIDVNGMVTKGSSAIIAHQNCVLGWSPDYDCSTALLSYSTILTAASSITGLIEVVAKLPPTFADCVQAAGRVYRKSNGYGMVIVRKSLPAAYSPLAYIQPKFLSAPVALLADF